MAIVLGCHLAVSVVLWLAAMTDIGAASFYGAVFFILWNLPGLWILKGLGLSSAMDALGFAYGGPVMWASTAVVLAAVLFATNYARKLLVA